MKEEEDGVSISHLNDKERSVEKRKFQHEERNKTISIPSKSKERVSTLYLQYTCTGKQRGREERKVT